VGGDLRRWLWSAALGGRFQATSQESLSGSETFGSLAAAIRLGALQVGPEILVWAATGDPPARLVQRGLGAEALLGARYAVGPVSFGLGGGPGIGRLPGTPAFRFLGAVSVAADARAARAGGAETGSASPAPAIPRAAPAPGQRPQPLRLDLDGDGVPDAEDACPALIGEPRPPRPGCPPDQDEDGIYDRDDRCPAVAGVASTDPEKNGCPADGDGDGIPDSKDACPAERGEPTADPATTGCPRAVRVEVEQIVILQQVNFATGRAEILSDSFDVLGQVAAAMKQHPEIARVAVDGHTDSDGAQAANLELSRRRALAVVRWLTEHGVDARRLEARGFGPRRPIADNRTAAGRAKNRRVEFLIRRRTSEGEAGWRDGPLDE
jgi:outer membrane protein OmpA-like peptidoglycan-associated protein